MFLFIVGAEVMPGKPLAELMLTTIILGFHLETHSDRRRR